MTATTAITISKLITKALVRPELCEKKAKECKVIAQKLLEHLMNLLWGMSKILCENMNLL